MRVNKKILSIMFCIIAITIYTLSGCQLILKEDMKRVLNAYTAEDSVYRYYTFKATVKSVIEINNTAYENEKLFTFDVNYEDFESKYGDDEYATLDGAKRWESAYKGFNKYEFMLIQNNYQILNEKGGYDFLQEGNEVIITANDYYGWAGWKYPILGVSIGDTTYLDFETGQENYLNFVKNGFKNN